MTDQRKVAAAGAALAIILAAALFLLLGNQRADSRSQVISSPTAGAQPQATLTSTAIPGTPTATPASSASDPRYEITYVNQGALWLTQLGVDTPPRKLLDGECVDIRWSPSGDRLVCRLPGTPDRATFMLRIVDGTGKSVVDIADASGFVWSPSGSHLAYLADPSLQNAFRMFIVDKNGQAVTDLPTAYKAFGPVGIVWSPESAAVAYGHPLGISSYHLATGRQMALLNDASSFPLAWVRQGQAVLIATEQRECERACYKAAVLDIGTGRTTPVPALDNSIDHWVSPDASLAVFVSNQVENGRIAGIGLGILDFSNQVITPITGSSISYPSDHIPTQHVVWTPDSSHVYWFHSGASWGEGGVYRARRDGQEFTQIKDWGPEPVFGAIRFSPDVRKALILRPVSQTGTWRLLDLQTNAETQASLPSGFQGWRPLGPQN